MNLSEYIGKVIREVRIGVKFRSPQVGENYIEIMPDNIHFDIRIEEGMNGVIFVSHQSDNRISFDIPIEKKASEQDD